MNRPTDDEAWPSFTRRPLPTMCHFWLAEFDRHLATAQQARQVGDWENLWAELQQAHKALADYQTLLAEVRQLWHQ